MIPALHVDRDTRDATWDEFLRTWPPHRVATMALEEYARAGDPETFTYWLEARTRELGRLWGGTGSRFGIFHLGPEPRRAYGPPTRFRSDGEYAWYAKYGEDRDAAFARIRELILAVIAAARAGRLEDLEPLELGRVLKWKIASLYQERRDGGDLPILPIFSKNALRFILDVPEKRVSIAELQRRARRVRGGREFWSFYEEARAKWAGFEEARRAVLAFEGEEEYADGEEPEAEAEDWGFGPPGNLILYGPPGTGKTHHLQTRLLPPYQAGERYAFVTFHPGYAYEDFVEGIRPEPDPASGGLRYEVKPGVFRRICALAKADPARRYALFIDEINRGNVARIFGELITLIEDDKRCEYYPAGEPAGASRARLRPGTGLEVTLPYSGERFGVPANLDIFGTMNTADRSTASLDVALRRRFRFQEMLPDPGQIKGTRGDGTIPDDEGGGFDLRALLAALNRRLLMVRGRDIQLGHAYVMKCRTLEDVRLALRDQILPLLQDYFNGDYSLVQKVLGDLGPDGAEYPDAIVRSERLPAWLPDLPGGAGEEGDDGGGYRGYGGYGGHGGYGEGRPDGGKAYRVGDPRDWTARVLKRIYRG